MCSTLWNLLQSFRITNEYESNARSKKSCSQRHWQILWLFIVCADFIARKIRVTPEWRKPILVPYEAQHQASFGMQRITFAVAFWRLTQNLIRIAVAMIKSKWAAQRFESQIAAHVSTGSDLGDFGHSRNHFNKIMAAINVCIDRQTSFFLSTPLESTSHWINLAILDIRDGKLGSSSEFLGKLVSRSKNIHTMFSRGKMLSSAMTQSKDVKLKLTQGQGRTFKIFVWGGGGFRSGTDFYVRIW